MKQGCWLEVLWKRLRVGHSWQVSKQLLNAVQSTASSEGVMPTW